jgi:hypothetical protein
MVSHFSQYFLHISLVLVNTDNTMEEEIKERRALGNKVYFANKNMFQSRLISKKSKVETILFSD